MYKCVYICMCVYMDWNMQLAKTISRKSTAARAEKPKKHACIHTYIHTYIGPECSRENQQYRSRSQSWEVCCVASPSIVHAYSCLGGMYMKCACPMGLLCVYICIYIYIYIMCLSYGPVMCVYKCLYIYIYI